MCFSNFAVQNDNKKSTLKQKIITTNIQH